jgi:hypothetical protein
MLRVLFFTPISLCLASRLHSVGGEPVTGAGLGDKSEYHLQDRMKCSVQCWTNE